MKLCDLPPKDVVVGLEIQGYETDLTGRIIFKSQNGFHVTIHWSNGKEIHQDYRHSVCDVIKPRET